MKNKVCALFVGVLMGSLLLTSGYAQDNQKLAQTGFQFLSVVSDARSAAMADALTSLQLNSSALFSNPAGMSGMEKFFDMSASINQWIADIKHYTFSVAISPAKGNYGVIGFSVQSVDYGEFYGTRVNRSVPLGYDDTGMFKLSSLALGVGYAKQLTDRFGVGAHVRWVHQDLGESMIAVNIRTDTTDPTGQRRIADTSLVTNKLSPLVFDFGTQFKTGFKSLVFGMSVRNFSGEVKYAEESFQAPLVFTLGISMDLMDLIGTGLLDQSLILSIDASHYNDHPEQLKIGVEYRIMQILFLRGGYANDNGGNGLSFGLGVSQFGFAVDYAYTPFGVFDKVQRMTARISM
ncbi:MAG: PorV/PorQ family protein [Ignavibacteriales bacterium]|nr:PorV/PorQ family protein [Ignavibacteriales bacterium]